MIPSSKFSSIKRLLSDPTFARHSLKALVPRNRSLLGISFPETEATIDRFLTSVDTGTYRVRESDRARITRSGVVRVGGHFLSTDYGPFGVFRPMPARPTSPLLHFSSVLVLWSHNWTTYYHWLIDIAPKLAAARRRFGAHANELMLLYPGELQPYERETVEELGFSLNRLVNLHKTRGVTANNIYIMPLPGFFRIDPRLRELRSLLAIKANPHRRLYLSRQGRRRILNESTLYALLEQFQFEFVPDIPRSLRQQIGLFSTASHIVAPHGAGLSNMIWSASNTRILELSSSIYAPEYFRELAAECGAQYERLKFGTGESDWTATASDFEVDVHVIRQFLEHNWHLRATDT